MSPGLRLLLIFALVLSGCASAPRSGSRELPPVELVSSADDQVTLTVIELACQSCLPQIVSGCREIPGVASVDVDRKEHLLTVHFDSSVTSRARVLAAVADVVASLP